jgi:hypothetical protein
VAVLITKANGETEGFDPQKLLRSLTRAGASQAVAEEVLGFIESSLRPGITTQEIYRRAFVRLRENRGGIAARYSLKRAVLEFGPSGFPFENYLAALYRAEGYTAKVDQIIQGACVEHEVDLVLRKKNEITYVEAKFHNTIGFKTDLKTTLYVKARLDDITAARKEAGEKDAMRGLIATNTKFTSHALRFAACAGVELLGWEHPVGNTLHTKIEKTKLYPVTALTTLGRREKMALLGQKVVLCGALKENTGALAAAGVSGHKADTVLEEVGALCATPPPGVE